MTPPAAMTRCDRALALARRGFEVFPLAPASKEPLRGSRGVNDATRDEAKIREWWGHTTDANIGIHGGRFVGRDMVVIDLDVKGADGPKHFQTLADEAGGVIPRTLCARTATKGLHKFFLIDRPIRNSVGKLAPGIDVRGANGYVVAPGSVINGVEYVFENPAAAIAECPDWLARLLSGAQSASAASDRTPLAGIKADRAEQRAIQYLQTDAPLAVKGQGGDQTTYRVAARVKDLGVGQDRCHALMFEHWNPRCPPGWSFERLGEKVAHAYRYGIEPQGIAAPETQFTPVEDEPWLAEMNSMWAFTIENGRASVVREVYDEDFRRFTIERSTVDDLTKIYANRVIQVGQDHRNRAVFENMATAWMKSPRRRQYLGGVTFNCRNTHRQDQFNLWRGFAIPPVPGDCSQIISFIRDVVAAGDERVFEYLLNWIALIFQRPEEPAKVAVVLRGAKGTGKSTLGHFIRKIVGQHAVFVSHHTQLTGRFNYHRLGCIFLHADEALYPNDRQHEPVLKALITEPVVSIEAKGRDVITAKNMVHLLMTTNDSHAVPASNDERRYLVACISNVRRNDRPYFKALWEHAEAGGLAAFHDYLLHRDLTSFDVFAVPVTQELTDQKIHSLRGPERWLYDCLANGRSLASGSYPSAWPEDESEVDRAAATRECQTFCRGQREYRDSTTAEIGRSLARVLGSRVVAAKAKVRAGEPRPWVWRVAGLSECREAMRRYLGAENIEWDATETPHDRSRPAGHDIFAGASSNV